MSKTHIAIPPNTPSAAQLDEWLHEALETAQEWYAGADPDEYKLSLLIKYCGYSHSVGAPHWSAEVLDPEHDLWLFFDPVWGEIEIGADTSLRGKAKYLQAKIRKQIQTGVPLYYPK